MALLKFLKGNYSSLNNAAINEGQVLICGDTGEMFVDVAADKRVKIGDFTVISNLSALEALDATAVPTSRLYYVEDGNILARSNGTTWVQVNKQPTIAELKTQLGLGDLAYKSEIAEGDLNEALAKKINDASAANHGHDNKTVLDGITAEKVAAWDASEQNAKDHADTELAKKVDKEDGKSLIADTEITRLAGMSDGANKVEASETNGNIKIDGVETVVYTHPEKHAIDDITGLQDALDGKQAAGDYATKTELGDVDAKFANYRTSADQDVIDNGHKERIEALEAKFTGDESVDAKIAAAVKAEEDARKEAVQGVQDEIDAVEGRMDTAEGKITALETESAKHAIKTEVEAALALKADKSVVDAMYTNTQIDELVQGAKDYADANDADTKYGIVYDSENKKIKLVEGGTEVEIDATDFIKDGMIETVTIGDDNDLVITFNTAAGKENIVLPLDQLVDIYTGVEGARIKVTVASDKSISADLVAGSISKNYLDDGVQTSLGKADTALQTHQDISHLAVKTEVATDIENAVKAETERATGVENGLAGRIKDLEDNKAGYATTGEVATAKQEAIDAAAGDATTKANAAKDAAIADAAEKYETKGTAQGIVDGLKLDETYEPIGAETRAKSYADTELAKDRERLVALEAIDHDYAGADAALKTELQKEIDDDVKALADTVYTQDEVDAAIETAVTNACSWGEF